MGAREIVRRFIDVVLVAAVTLAAVGDAWAVAAGLPLAQEDRDESEKRPTMLLQASTELCCAMIA